MEDKMIKDTETDTGFSTRNSVTSIFKDRDIAEKAAQKLTEAGISSGNVRLIADGSEVAKQPEGKKRIWDRLEDFLFPAEDRALYSEGIRRGHYLVTASGLSSDQYETALTVLEEAGAVDFDMLADTWRSEGWDDTQDYLDKFETPLTVIDSKDAAKLVSGGHGDDVVKVITKKLNVGTRDGDQAHPRVRVYKVEYALKNEGEKQNPDAG
jgi:hypothetical protein